MGAAAGFSHASDNEQPDANWLEDARELVVWNRYTHLQMDVLNIEISISCWRSHAHYFSDEIQKIHKLQQKLCEPPSMCTVCVVPCEVLMNGSQNPQQTAEFCEE